MSDNFKPLATSLVEWYVKHKRDLPWRATNDPYKIWVSEIILQQTTVKQGLPYYQKFIKHFPNVSALAQASEDKILKLWQGLGYYSRARNMHYTAKYIQSNYNGTFPDNYKSIRELKGIGDYTAAAISSIAFNLPFPVVDGNVLRVISRLENISEPVDTKPVLIRIKDVCEKLIQGQAPGDFNQAIMELGALVCTPRNPQCGSCPLRNFCNAFANETQLNLPVKSKKLKKRSRYFNYFVIKSGKSLVLQKRANKDIWQGLYQFPLIEVEKSEFQRSPETFPFDLSLSSLTKSGTKVYKQTLTHQYIYAQFHNVKCAIKEIPSEYILVNKEAISSYPFPKIIDLYLDEKSITLF